MLFFINKDSSNTFYNLNILVMLSYFLANESFTKYGFNNTFGWFFNNAFAQDGIKHIE